MSNPELLLERLPRPQVVRERLAENLRENRLLRSLLRLSEKAVKAGATPSAENHSGEEHEA